MFWWGMTRPAACSDPHHPPQGAIKELTTPDRWDIYAERKAPNTLVATYKGVYLPPAVAPLVLEACTPTPPLATSDALAAALQPTDVDRVLRFAIRSPLDAT
jgi:hypothetical protein